MGWRGNGGQAKGKLEILGDGQEGNARTEVQNTDK